MRRDIIPLCVPTSRRPSKDPSYYNYGLRYPACSLADENFTLHISKRDICATRELVFFEEIAWRSNPTILRCSSRGPRVGPGLLTSRATPALYPKLGWLRRAGQSRLLNAEAGPLPDPAPARGPRRHNQGDRCTSMTGHSKLHARRHVGVIELAGPAQARARGSVGECG